MRNFCTNRNKIHYKKSQVFEIVGEKMTEGQMPLMCWETEMTCRFVYLRFNYVVALLIFEYLVVLTRIGQG